MVRTRKSHERVDKRTEGKVKSLGGEVTDDVGGVSSPEGDETLLLVGTGESITDALVGGGKTTLLDLWKCDVSIAKCVQDERWTNHLILVLDQELDTLNGGGAGLGDSLWKSCEWKEEVELLRAMRTAETPPIRKSTVKTVSP